MIWPILELGQKSVKNLGRFLGNGFSRKIGFEIYWPLQVPIEINGKFGYPKHSLKSLNIVKYMDCKFILTKFRNIMNMKSNLTINK